MRTVTQYRSALAALILAACGADARSTPILHDASAATPQSVAPNSTPVTIPPDAGLSDPPPQATSPFVLADGSRVVFYGDSITQEGGYARFVEEYARTRFPLRDFRFYNAGVGGDRVTGGGSGSIDVRLERDVIALKPTIVTIMLGMNDGGYKAFDEQAFSTFTEGYQAIVTKLKAALPNVQLTLIVSSPYDDISRPPQFDPGYDSVLGRFGGSVVALGAKENAAVVDFRAPLRAALVSFESQNPDLARQLLPDRVHPATGGHTVMGATLLRGWHAPSLVTRVEIDAANLRLVASEATEVTALSATENGLSWTQLDRALPLPINFVDDAEIGLAQRAGADVDSLNQQPLAVTGLATGNYELKIGSQSVGVFSASDLGQGINLARYRTPMRSQAFSVKWSIASGHERQRVRRELLVAAEKNASLKTTADSIAQYDDTDQQGRVAIATPVARAYQLTRQ